MMADRIEAATLLLAGAITGGDVTALGADGGAMDAVLANLTQRFDHVLIDGPPILGLADALVHDPDIGVAHVEDLAGGARHDADAERVFRRLRRAAGSAGSGCAERRWRRPAAPG